MKVINDPVAIQKLKQAERLVVLTGAGVSAESGIPTFRGEEGLWKKLSPEELASFEAFYNNTAVVSEWYQHRREIIHNTEPNPGHHALAELQKLAPTFDLITQNVDGLHQRAGSSDVVELHGNIMENYCVNCNLQYSQEEFDDIFRHNPNHIPHCYCGGLIRPNVVWFGEALPEESIEKAYQASKQSDVFLSVGTSAQVSPASNLPRVAKQNNSYLIEINKTVTAISDIVDLHLEGLSGEILPMFLDDYKLLRNDK
ncbi:MAG: NAD-dependent deacylase [Candidatus Marinimicrobia bacterium]|nr:NAD-dependent deacylase [Candidatus Neomarinimicrobiota bacterium]